MENHNPVERAVARIGTQREAAEKLDPPVSQTSIWKWCQRGWAPIRRARQLADLSGIPVEHLIRAEDADLLGLKR